MAEVSRCEGVRSEGDVVSETKQSPQNWLAGTDNKDN